MMKSIAALLVMFASAASATTLTRDHSDLWYIPAESGWGINIAQQGDSLFATLFVYNQDASPAWFVASNLLHQGNNVFTGTLFRVTGPFYLGAFDPNAVLASPVGTMTFNASASPSNAMLTYSVNGQIVNKNITRQTFKIENIAGTYVGGSIGAYAGCTTGNGPYDQPATFTITTVAGSSVQISEFGPNYTCQYNGTYTQSGRLGDITGTGFCATQPGTQQTFHASDVTVTPEGLTAKLVAGVGPCQFTGRFGGVRRQ